MEVGMFSVLYLLFFAILRGGNAYDNNDIEKYWKSVLPNTVMPKPLKDLIQPPGGKINFHDVVAGMAQTEVAGNRNYGLPSKINFHDVVEGLAQTEAAGNRNYGLPSSDSRKKIRDVKETIFFFEEDVHEGKAMTLNFAAENGAPFLPRHVADSLPFSTTKLQQILKQFAIKPESKEAKGIEAAILDCEQPGIKGERRRCVTSLESMVDFVVSEFGTTNVKVEGTEVEGKGERQRYRIVGVKKLGEDDSVICHKQYYGYAVYYCHRIEATRSYGVSLVGDKDGSKVKASAICHYNTASWNPQHFAFKVLNVKPGTVPICHFLARETLVWLAN